MNHKRSNLKSKSTYILDEYSVTNKVLGLGINGKVVECIRKENGQKYALKVSVELCALCQFRFWLNLDRES